MQSYKEANEVAEMKITFSSQLDGNPVEIGREQGSFPDIRLPSKT